MCRDLSLEHNSSRWFGVVSWCRWPVFRVCGCMRRLFPRRKVAGVAGCSPHKQMRVQWNRGRLGLATVTVLVLVWLTVFLHHHFYPDILFPSTHLSAVPLHDFFWLDWVAGDYFQPRKTLVSPLPAFRIRPSEDCKDSTFLVVLVITPVRDLAVRQLIRQTWGGAVKNNRWPTTQMHVSVRVFFVLGTDAGDSPHSPTWISQVIQEAEMYDDLIMGNFTDSYRNLTLKTLTGLNWVRHHCTHSRFVMKQDQDTLVDFPRLTDFLLLQQDELHNAVIGKLYFNSKRLDKGKWKVSPEEYPLSLYPTFAGGPCYIISRDAVDGMVNVSQYLPFFVMEDVQVTGILAKAMGVRRLLVQQLRNWKVDSLCVLLEKDKNQVSMTGLTPNQIRQVWAMLIAGQCLHPQDFKTKEI